MARSRLKENIVSLLLLQGANYILPLLTVPYLVRILGPGKYGLIAFAQAFMQYFVLLTDYGFNFSATRLVSIHRDDAEKISRVFWSTMAVKLLLMVVSFALMAGIVVSVPRFRDDLPLYLISFLIVVGSVVFPVWFFQGMERMKLVSAFTIVSRLAYVAAVFVFVKREEDFLIAAALQAGIAALAGLLSLFFIRRVARFPFHFPRWAELLEALREGWHIFLSTAGISLYTNSNPVLLGLLAGNEAVGYFSAAQKVVKAVQGLISPVSQAVYPRVTALAVESRAKALEFIKKVLVRLGGASFVLSVLLFAGSPEVVALVLGPKFSQSLPSLRWMAFIPFVVALSNVFGVQTMLTFGMKQAFSRILLVSGILNLTMIIPLSALYGATGAAAAFFLTECFVTAVMALYLRKRQFRIISPEVSAYES